MMINEAPVWKKLLKNYCYAEHQKYWPERRSELREIVNEFPDSQWADDASLILACGKFEFEGKEGIDTLRSNADAYRQGYFANAEEAIGDLRNIVNKYPKGRTIIKPVWIAGGGCRFDGVWEMSQGSLVFLNADGSVRTTKAFDRNGKIAQDEKEILTYFDHLDKYPVYTKDVARIFISEILGHQGKYSEAALELEKFLSDTAEFAESVAADTSAASRVEGYLVRNIGRPRYRAFVSLMGYNQKLGRNEESILQADRLARIVNQGANIEIVKHIGRFYAQFGLQEKSKLQYRIALKKLESAIDIDKQRRILVDRIDPKDAQVNPRLLHEKEELEDLVRNN